MLVCGIMIQTVRHAQQKTNLPQKKTVTKRIDILLDAGSFEEVDHAAKSPLLDKPFETDGVITGFGTINGKQVALYAQDFSLKGGSLGKRHAEKIGKIMDMAIKIGCPIIGLIDSGGARIDEGIHALAGYGSIFMRNIRYSGVIPQYSLILGPCAGGAAYSPALTDFVFMVESISNMFITGPQVIQQVMHEEISKEALGGPDIHAARSGVAHAVFANENEALASLRSLITLLPNNYLETDHVSIARHSDHACSVEHLVPTATNQSYDMYTVIDALIDKDSFFEMHRQFAQNIIVGFAKIAGSLIGLVANQPLIKAGAIDIDASIKSARFIRFCNNFSIPIVSLVDVPGFLPGVDQEHNGIIRHGAKLLYAYAEATVPKITIILRKAFGGAYIVMGSKELGADFNFAWPNAQIAVLGAQAAVAILHRKDLEALPHNTRDEAQQQLEHHYTATFLNPHIAAESGYLDAIIQPDQTRHHIIKALEITRHKVEKLPVKKHGNIPL